MNTVNLNRANSTVCGRPVICELRLLFATSKRAMRHGHENMVFAFFRFCIFIFLTSHGMRALGARPIHRLSDALVRIVRHLRSSLGPARNSLYRIPLACRRKSRVARVASTLNYRFFQIPIDIRPSHGLSLLSQRREGVRGTTVVLPLPLSLSLSLSLSLLSSREQRCQCREPRESPETCVMELLSIDGRQEETCSRGERTCIDQIAVHHYETQEVIRSKPARLPDIMSVLCLYPPSPPSLSASVSLSLSPLTLPPVHHIGRSCGSRPQSIDARVVGLVVVQ